MMLTGESVSVYRFADATVHANRGDRGARRLPAQLRSGERAAA
jgi:hypothetical protein